MAVISYNCPKCSSNLIEEKIEKYWKCEHCKSRYGIEELKKYIDSKKEYDGYNCDNCGAEIVTYEDSLTTICAYCGSTAIVRGKFSGEYKPDFIVPFKNNKEDAVYAFLNQGKRKEMCPSNFFEYGNIKHVHGVYVPYWLFSCETIASLEGPCYNNCNRKIYIKRKASMTVERIPADAKTKMDNDFLGGLEPFDYEQMEPFKYSYLLGFNAEKYDDSIDATFEEQIQERICDAIINKIKAEDGISYDQKTIKSDAFVSDSKYEYELMPVWCIHVEYNGTEYKYYVNDQNLIVSGKYPVSFMKEIILWGLAGILIAMVVYLALSRTYLPVVFLLALIAISSCNFIFHTLSSYNNIKRKTKDVEYVNHKTFKFIEYKDLEMDKKIDFNKEKDDK